MKLMKKITIDYLDNKYEASINHIQTEIGITYEIKIIDNDLIEVLEGRSVFHINPTIPEGLNIIKYNVVNKEFQIAICNAIFLSRIAKTGFISYS